MVSMQIVNRLIRQFIPDSYQLSITIDRTKRLFSGVVTIKGVALEGHDSLRLHSKDLQIDSVTFDGKAAQFHHEDNDELVITHPDLTVGAHNLVIAYTGQITDSMHGMYPCYYDNDGAKEELIVTQFESHHAREVFPCIDEPEAKATFDLILTTEAGITVLSNMPAIHQVLDGDMLVTTFATTPRMSTYLLAWVTGKLHSVSTRTKSGVDVSIWATFAQPAASLTFALDIAARTIDFFDEYFQTPYPLSKADHVALPDFSSGAMENWGLITYREIALLAEPGASSVSTQHYIASVIAHELSHQWFGNLVTMKWWNDLWLNESFATLMEYIAIDALEPSWNIWLDFATNESIMALRRDSLDGVQAVQVEIHHPEEINTLFDGAIVYAKGARLLRMLQNHLGHEVFRAGLAAYFAAHAYQNTEADDLWRHLSRVSKKDIAEFMSAWISQSGYPVVSVDIDGDVLNLRQTQFFTGPHEPSQKLWPIPLNATWPELPAMLVGPEHTSTITSHTPALRLNTGDTAHFITHYGQSLLKNLIASTQRGDLQPLDRLQLLHEQTLLARGGIISSASLIPLVKAYKEESEEAVWDIMSLTIGELKKFVFADLKGEQKLRRFSADLARAQYARLGWQKLANEPQTDTKLRAVIIGMMLYGEEDAVIEKAKAIFDSSSLEQLEPELRPLIIGAAVRHEARAGLIDELLAAYTSTQSAELQQDIAAGLASSRDTVVIARLLDCISDESIVRPQDVVRWFTWLIRNRDGRTPTWSWLRKNWSWISRVFAGDKSYDDFPRYAASALLTRNELAEYRQFFGPMQSDPALKRVITVGISEIEARVDLIERDGPLVRAALAKL